MLLAKSRRLVAAVTISLCVSAGAGAAAPTIQDFATQADSIYPSISPDGNMVAFVTRVEGNRVLMVIDLDELRRAIAAFEKDLGLE